MQEATIVSEGTVNPVHLIATFWFWLVANARDVASEVAQSYGEDLAGMTDYVEDIRHVGYSWHEPEAIATLHETLTEAMEENAPAGTYFGAHEGDGALLGFWPVEEDTDDLPGWILDMEESELAARTLPV